MLKYENKWTARVFNESFFRASWQLPVYILFVTGFKMVKTQNKCTLESDHEKK